VRFRGNVLEAGGETRVSAETLRRVDCSLVAVGHDGQALSIGRRALMLRNGQISPESLSWHKRATEAARINGYLEAHYRPKLQTYTFSPPSRAA
jgi:hypothetical protein